MNHKASRHTAPKKGRRLIDEQKEQLRVAECVERNGFIATDLDMPIVPRVGKTQARYLTAVIRLGDDAYNARIQKHLRETFGKEYNIGQISMTAAALEEHGLIRPKPGGSPSGKGRPVTIYTVTRLGLLALEQTLEYLDEMEEEPTLVSSPKAEGVRAHPRGSGTTRKPTRVH